HQIRYATIEAAAAAGRYAPWAKPGDEVDDGEPAGAVQLYNNLSIPLAFRGPLRTLGMFRGTEPAPELPTVPDEELLLAHGIYTEAGFVAGWILDYHDQSEEHGAEGLEIDDSIAARIAVVATVRETGDRESLFEFAEMLGVDEPTPSTLVTYGERAAEILRD